MKPVLLLLAGILLPATVRAQHLDPYRVPVIHAAPGADMRELLGLGGALTSQRLSVALFTLAPGAAYPESYNRNSEEIFLVRTGQGTVWLDGQADALRAGDIVRIGPGVRHRIAASAAGPLAFYAISAPPFRPEDYVPTR